MEGVKHVNEPENLIPWPDPTPEMLESPEFEAVWGAIKTWDIEVPGTSPPGYSGATGNHVRAILDALGKVNDGREERGEEDTP